VFQTAPGSVLGPAQADACDNPKWKALVKLYQDSLPVRAAACRSGKQD
jgi:hypothetical protein